MKWLLIVLFAIPLIGLKAQTTTPPLSEADKALLAEKQAPIIEDSLKKVYAGRWTIGFSYGRRYISKGNKTLPDSITFVDFSKSKAVFGLKGGYFASDRLKFDVGMELLIVPKKQEINEISFGGTNGINVEGEGNGGVMVKLGIAGKYFFKPQALTRPFVGLKLGSLQLRSAGGSAGFSNGVQFEDVVEQTANYRYAQILAGINRRFTPALMGNASMAYMHSSRAQNIGGIISPGGISISLTLSALLNARKK